MTAAAPTITVVIPMRNEASHITPCLESVLASELPAGMTFELLVFDGESSDNSAALVTALAARDPRVRLLHNPERLQAAAFNRGLAAARGEYLVRLDAHSLYGNDYLAEAVRLLDSTGAANVGGLQRATGEGILGRAIAAAVSSRFAAGDAQYRHATEPTWTDTVYLGAWRTATVRELGGMHADWAVNEDYEMNVRLRARGGRVYLSPTLQSTYFVRDSLPKLVRQYTRYGFWKVRTLLLHPGSLRWRQAVAPAFVLSLIATPLLVHFLGWIGALHLAVYFAANIAASILVARQHGWALLPCFPLIFFLIHCSWGSGFIAGTLYWPWQKR
ncbi:MAG: glycosyltransferase family 2 protein [Gemmatimonadales bacterium]